MGGLVNAFLGAIAKLALGAVNGLIKGLGVVISALVAILPDMPSVGSPPAAFTQALEWVSWVFPVGTLVDCLTFTLAMFLVWSLVVIALRWAKANGE